MTQNNELVDALRAVLQAFDALGIEYRIGGSVASSAFGRARSTMDIDMVADVSKAHIEPLCAALRQTYYLDDQAMREAIERKAAFNLIHLATLVKVDVFVRDQAPYDRVAFQRKRTVTLGALTDVVFCTAEDILLRKLQWYRNGGEISERQWADVVGLLQVQGEALDQGYLDQWAEQLGLADLLARAEKQAHDEE